LNIKNGFMAHKPVPIARQKSWVLSVQITISYLPGISAWLSVAGTTVRIDKFYLRLITDTLKQ
jgi:hypothetical protein